MSSEYEQITKLLALEQEHFKDEVHRLGISTTHLTPLQVLQAIQHAQLWFDYTFIKEDFLQGKVGAKMTKEDFNFEENHPKLLEERERAFKEELETMSRVLKTQFEEVAKKYKDLPADTPVCDLHKLAGFDTSKLPKMEKSGERLLRDIKEWTLKEMSSQECAILPEDKLQQIMVGACNQLEIACYIEQTALNLRWDAVRVMKVALAGMATTKFLNVMEAAFGKEENEEEVPNIAPTEEDQLENLLLGAMTTKEEADVKFGEPSTSTVPTKHQTRSSTKQSSVKCSCKQEAPTKISGPFTLQDANKVFPTKGNKQAYLHTGVPNECILQRESGPYTKVAIYHCNYARVCCERGEKPQECDVICQSRGQMSTHIRQFHLNVCVECYVCGHRWWSAFEWKKHMKSEHSDLLEDEWFILDEAVESNLTVKKEVTGAEVLKDIDEGDDNDDDK